MARAKAPADSPAALETYVKKRDFKQTPEPGPGPAKKRTKALRFVIQMHRATRLHFDLRLEADGVLKSWAVTRGPTLDPKEKRLAVHVEDHPYDYRDFEGIIPKGNYGAGEVIVWDHGTYTLFEGTDPTAEIAKGKIKFVLAGEKLRGLFTLVKMRARDGEENAWLLIKDKDDGADPSWKLEDHDRSVITGRTVDDIKRGVTLEPIALPKSPMLATTVDEPFDGDDWIFEIKWDGYRALCAIDAPTAYRLVSRNGTDFTQQLPEFASLPKAFGGRRALVDGEIVVLDANGRSSFSALQKRLDRYGRGATVDVAATYVAFDLLSLDGEDLRGLPLLERKRRLAEIFVTGHGATLSDHIVGNGTSFFALARDHELEGIIAKRKDSTYQDRRTRDWLKIKARRRQEFAIGGWTEARGSRTGFGALLVGLYADDGLIYAGAVGTGFTAATLAKLTKRLHAIARETTPFTTTPATETAAHFVAPELVAEVTFAEWTSDGLLRQAAFVGLRTDKDPRDCVREVPVPTPAPAPAANVTAAPSRFAVKPGSAEIGGRRIALSNQDKVLWPRDGYTKGDLVAYYRAVSPWMLPHLAARPLTMERYPNGIDQSSFFEKHKPRGMPEWIPTVTVPSDRGHSSAIEFIVCNDEATLAYVANLAAIVLHVWTSRVGSLDVPEFVFFDLDPWEGCTLKTLATVAVALRDALAQIGLESFVKSSGGSGLHVAVPLAPTYGYDVVKLFAELVARHINTLLPKLTTLARVTAKRPHGTVYLDYVQVGQGKTLVPAFGARARDGAPVSMPLAWAEIESMTRKRTADPSDEFVRWTIANVPKLLAKDGDFWNIAAWPRQKLETALERAATLWA